MTRVIYTSKKLQLHNKGDAVAGPWPQDVPILNFEAYVMRIETDTSAVNAEDWTWLGNAFGGADMATRGECYSYDLRRGDLPYELKPGNERRHLLSERVQDVQHLQSEGIQYVQEELLLPDASESAEPLEFATTRHLLGGAAPPAPVPAPVPPPADRMALCYCNRYADLRTRYCGGRQCTSFSQGNQCASHWNSAGLNENRLWGCISASEMAKIEADKLLVIQKREWVPKFGKMCAPSQMADDEMLVVSAVLSTGKHIFGRVFNKKWFQGHYTDPVNFGKNPAVVDPGAMLVELTGRRIYRNIFTEKRVLSVDDDWGYSFQSAISFLPHKRIAYVEGVGFESFVDEKDMALRHRKEQCLKTAMCYGDRFANLKTEFCGGTACRTVEQGMKLEDHWNFHGRFDKSYVFKCGASDDPERSRVINALCYGNRFKDLVDSMCSEGECKTDEEAAELELHYTRHGKLDNRQWGCTPTTAEICYGDANIKWDLSDTSKRCIDAHGVSDASLRASAGARAVIGVQSFSAYFVKRPFSNAKDKTPMWTANETSWVSATLNKAAGRDKDDCSMCKTMWDATCFNSRIHGSSMRALSARCAGKLDDASSTGVKKLLLVAMVLDNGRKVLGTTSIDPKTKTMNNGRALSTPDPFASLMSVTSQTEYVQRDAPAGKTSVDNAWNSLGTDYLSWHDFHPSFTNMLDSLKCDIGTYYGPEAHNDNEVGPRTASLYTSASIYTSPYAVSGSFP